MTLWERENALDFTAMIDTVKCLYSRELRPLYSEKDCSCETCYDRGTWSFIIQHASHLNNKLIWNDIIKRWEPKEFDQEFAEDVETNSNYEFRTYKSIYGTQADSYNDACDACPPFDETRRGIGFIKSFTSFDSSETTEGCCLCNLLSPSIVIQNYDGSNWATVSDNANTSFVYNASGAGNKRLLFRVGQDIVNDIIPCGTHLWKSYQTDYNEEADGYILSNLLPTYGNIGGEIVIKFVDLNDNSQTFECRYEWEFKVQ